VFNLGVGYIAIVPAESAELAVRVLADAGETAWVAGELVEGDGVVLH
jgi:phosphoribosylformylglycinamidine cyclo-ligase